jgi:hypothetical protein
MMMMMVIMSNYKRVVKYLDVLRDAGGTKQRQRMFKNFPDVIVEDIIEIIINLADLNIKPSKKAPEFFRKNKKPVQDIYRVYRQKKKRRDVIRNQSGGFISALIPILSGVVASLL